MCVVPSSPAPSPSSCERGRRRSSLNPVLRGPQRGEGVRRRRRRRRAREPVSSGGWSRGSGPRCRMAAAVRMNIQMLLEAADYLERRERGARGREGFGPRPGQGSEGPGRGSGRPTTLGVVGGSERATASAPNPSSSLHARSAGRLPLPQRQRMRVAKGPLPPEVPSATPSSLHPVASGVPGDRSARLLVYLSGACPGRPLRGPAGGAAPLLYGSATPDPDSRCLPSIFA